VKTGRIALLHLQTIPGAVEHNQHVIVEAIKQAASGGAQWIVTPELAVCGLQFPRILGTDWIQPQPDPWMQRVCGLMKDLRRTLFLACPEREGRRLYNSVFVIDTNGEIVGRHRKINIASDALSWSSPGYDATPIDCDGCKVGVLVCSDAYTPNIARVLRFNGARMLVSPTSWGPGIHGPNGEWEDRTRETSLPLIVCNRTGAEKTIEFWKAPSLVVVNGERVLSSTSDRSVILTFDWNFGSMTLQSTDYQSYYVKMG
jgi:N-carbamoylputrescine amidase